MSKAWNVRINAAALTDSKRGTARGLLLAAEHILNVANTKVPTEKGALEKSWAASVDGSSLRAAVSYDTPYAVIQHESMNSHHDAGRSAKYLENAMTSEARTVGKIIANEIRKG